MTVTMYKTSILVITMLAIFSLAAPVMAGGELNVTREISDQTVAPGSTFTVTLTVTANEDVTAPTLNEDIPVGAVTVIDSAGMMYKASTDEYIFLDKMSAGESKTVIYEVTVPEDAEMQEYNITGTASGYDVDPSEIGGDGGVTVESGYDYDSADTDHDCVVGPMELMVQIGKWKRAEVCPMELMASIGRWKLGAGGYC